MQPQLHFSTPIWHYSCSTSNMKELNKSLVADAYKLRKEERTQSVSGVNSWQSHRSVHSLPMVGGFFSAISDIITTLLEPHGTHNLTFAVEGAWFNINPPMSWNERHNHRGHAYAGVYILQKPTDSGELLFHDPRVQLTAVPAHPPNNPLIDGQRRNANAQVGDVVIFPSWLEHSVSLNKSTGDRVSLAFNIGCIDQ